MSEAPDLEGAFASAGAMGAIHLRESAGLKQISGSNGLMRRLGNHAAIADFVRDGTRDSSLREVTYKIPHATQLF